MVKYVVDVERGIVAIGGEMHADAEAALLEAGSRQADLWGANYYPGRGRDGCIEYTSLINIRPGAGNRGMELLDPNIARAARRNHLRPHWRGRDRLIMAAQHAGLSPERFARFTRGQQLLTIANEMNRASKLFGAEDLDRLRGAYERVMSLADLTVQVNDSRSLRRELLRWRDLVAEQYIAAPPDPHAHALAFRALLQLAPGNLAAASLCHRGGTLERSDRHQGTRRPRAGTRPTLQLVESSALWH